MKWDISDFDNWTSDQFPAGMVGKAGTSADYVTGGWRSERPVWNHDNCKHCMLCWIVCPDAAIHITDKQMTGIDFNHCKGCGVCVTQCRFDALKMVPEHSEEV